MNKTQSNNFDVVLVTAPKDIDLVGYNISIFLEKISPGKIIVIANKEMKAKVPDISGVEFLDEDTLIKGLTLEKIKNLIMEKTGGIEIQSNWYFQQFLKMAYAYCCNTDYYLIWDADTLLLRHIDFWEDTSLGKKCLFTLKDEYVYSYFDTLKILFNGEIKKQINQSFIAEHMMINKDIMLEMIRKIEANNNINGKFFYEKIINAVKDKYIYRGFSEFETYGNYVQTFYPGYYSFRKLKTFRNGNGVLNNSLLNKDTIRWLAKNFDTISMEKWSYRGLFYKLSVKIVPFMVKYRVPCWCLFLLNRVYSRIYFAVLFYIQFFTKKTKMTEDKYNDEDTVVIYIGFNNPFEYKRGVENVILFQSRFLPEYVKKYYIYSSKTTENNMLWEGMFCIGIKRGLKQFKAFRKVIYKIKFMYEKPKIIIHSHNILFSAFIDFKTDILTIHDGLYYLRSKGRHPLRLFHWMIEKKAYKNSRKIHFISNFTRYNSLFKNKINSFTISNTTPLEPLLKLFENQPGSRTSLLLKDQDEIGRFRGNRFVIFTVRGIEQRTRIDLFVDLAIMFKNNKTLLNNKIPVITVAGKGPMLEFYQEKIAENKVEDYISLTGYISDPEIVSYYKTCDMVIVTAEYGEGFGLPVIEAYCAGKPVLASNVCGIPEVIIDKKYLFENDVPDLYNKVIMFSSNINIKQEVTEYYNAKYSNNAIGKLYMDSIYKDIK